jgi:hypothetical protein
MGFSVAGEACGESRRFVKAQRRGQEWISAS